MTRLFIISLATCSLVACGKGSTNNPFKALGQLKEAPELQGQYKLVSAKDGRPECLGSRAEALATGIAGLFGIGSSGDAIKSQTVRLKFEGNTVTREEIHFVNADCTNEAYKFSERGTFKVGKKTSEPKEMRGLDLNFKELTVSINGRTAADAANAFKLCGRNDWTEKSRDVSVKDHAGERTCYNGAVERQVANSFRVDGKRLYLGDAGKGAIASEARPSSSGKSLFEK